ncbi:MAG: FAD/NAD(P)-binding protein [Byssovorax sp.]
MIAAPLPLLHPMIPALYRLSRVVRELPGVFTFHLDMRDRPGGFPFSPGQFNMLYVFGAGEVPISISGDPAEPGELVHTIRAVGAATRALEKLDRGDVIGVRGPFGAGWPMAEAAGKDLLILAGGLGLAPLRPAIVHALAHRKDYRRVIVLYGARTPGDILYRAELERWRGRFDTTVEVTVDRAEPDWPTHVGVVPALLSGVSFDPENAAAMICGPEVMMRFSARELEKKGLSPERMFVSMERSMKCGAGLCGHCQLGPSFVCKDGPVYRFSEVQRLFYTREV